MARGGNTYGLVPGVATTVQLPAAGQQYAAVVMQNISPYLCVVSVGVDQYFLAPYTADLFPLMDASGNFSTGQPPSVVPSNLDNVTGVPANLTATFYEPGEAPTGGYPVSLSSPAAIASETAAALLTTGVPNVLVEKQLATLTLNTTDTAPQPTPAPGLAISGYASLILDFFTNNAGGAPSSTIQMIQYHANGDQAYEDILYYGASLPGPAYHSFVMPVLGSYAQFWELTGNNPTTLTVSGSNRSAPRGYSPQTIPSAQYATGTNRIQSIGTLTATAMTAGTAYPLNSGRLALGQQLQADFGVMNSTTVKGVFYAVDDNGTFQYLTDTAEAGFHVVDWTNAEQHIYKNIILPLNTQAIRFGCKIAGTASLQIQATPLL